MRIGVFGGTFDPPHVGHLIVAQDAYMRLGLERVVFIPAATPPHKQDRDVSPAEVRLAMLRAAVAGDGRFTVDDLEIRRGGASYTVDTLRALHERHPDARPFLLIGADQFQDLHTWREPLEISRLATLAVMTRAGAAPFEGGAGVVSLAVTRIDVSATEIRRRVGAGEPIRYLVPPEVERLIAQEQLYRQVGTRRTSPTTAG